MFKENIEQKMFPESKPITDTHKIYSVHSTGAKDWVQIWFTSCCCLKCMSNSGPCMYPAFVDDWELRFMTKEGNQLWDPEVKHWKQRLRTMKEYDQMVRVSTCHLTHFEERKEKVFLHFQ